jgi:hypothetical protein
MEKLALGFSRTPEERLQHMEVLYVYNMEITFAYDFKEFLKLLNINKDYVRFPKTSRMAI